MIGDDPRTVTFCEAPLSASQVRHPIKPTDPVWVETIGRYHLDWAPFQRTWLMSYMIDRQTWPVPIMVENVDGDGYRLVEGHKRLGYLGAQIDSGRVSIDSTRTVLIVFEP